MFSLKGTYKSLYKKTNKNGVLTTVFRYVVTGNDASLAKYKKVLEDRGVPVHTDEASGKMFYFTTVHNGDNINIEITDTDKIIVANNDLEKLQSKLQLATDPALKQAMANRIAEMVLGISAPASVAPVASAPVAQSAVETADEEDAEL